MKQLLSTLILAGIVLCILGIFMWLDENVVKPKQKKYHLDAIKKARRRLMVNPRRLCSKHITVLSVPGSVAVLDEVNCYLCARRNDEKV